VRQGEMLLDGHDQGLGGESREQEVCLVEDIDEMSAKDSRRAFTAGR
jgi:hypothetical protein